MKNESWWPTFYVLLAMALEVTSLFHHSVYYAAIGIFWMLAAIEAKQ